MRGGGGPAVIEHEVKWAGYFSGRKLKNRNRQQGTDQSIMLYQVPLHAASSDLASASVQTGSKCQGQADFAHKPPQTCSATAALQSHSPTESGPAPLQGMLLPVDWVQEPQLALPG